MEKDRDCKTERQMRTNQAKMRHDLLLFSFLSVFFLDASLDAASQLLLYVLMHKFRSSTKP